MTAHDSPDRDEVAHSIRSGHTALGIELGSTRIKAALIGPTHRPIATGAHAWSNQFIDGLWTYDLTSVVAGLQSCYAQLADNVRQRLRRRAQHGRLTRGLRHDARLPRVR